MATDETLFRDLTERAKQMTMTLSIHGTRARNEAARDCDQALTEQPDRDPVVVLTEVLHRHRVHCGVKDDGRGSLVHAEHEPADCGEFLARRMLDRED